MALSKSMESSRTLKAPTGAKTVEKSDSSASPPTSPGDGKGVQQLQAKWGRDLLAAGWLALPSIILERQDALGLDAIDINIILHIAKHWFEAANLPHPSKGSIAKAMGLTPRAVQKRIARLDDEGFIRRIERRGPKGSKGSQTSEFELTGLIEKATPHAIEAVQEREKVRQMKLERLRRKRPRVESPDRVEEP